MLFLDGKSDRDIAAKLGLTRQAVWLYRQDPDIAARLEQHRSELITTALTDLAALGSVAVSVVRETLEDEDASPALRLTAARLTLDQLLRYTAQVHDTPAPKRSREEMIAQLRAALAVLEGQS